MPRPQGVVAWRTPPQLSINYLGHFLLVNLLLDCLTEDGRVVFTASGTHDPETMDGKMVGKAVEPDGFALANEGKEGPISENS